MRICGFILLSILPSAGIAQLDAAREGALGRQLAQVANRQSRPINDQVAEDYVNTLGERITTALETTVVKTAATPPPRFTFSVIAGDPCHETHEPGALPGGYVFVPVALFTRARDEAEFAGMLAHAMAHVALRHTTPHWKGPIGDGSATIPLVFAGGMGGSCSEGMVIPRPLIATMRRNEAEADIVAVETMARAGFDPVSLLNYITRLTNMPNRDERIAAIDRSRSRLPSARYSAPEGDYTTIRAHVIEFAKSVDQPNGRPTLRRTSN